MVVAVLIAKLESVAALAVVTDVVVIQMTAAEKSKPIFYSFVIKYTLEFKYQ